jgi:uncharacterized protein (DUF697 family)
MGDLDKKTFAASVQANFNKALASQSTVAVKNIERLRSVHPEMSPVEMQNYLQKWYIGSVTASGAAAGAAAAVPNGVVQIPAALADFLGFLELSVLYVYSMIELHGMHPQNDETRRLLVSAVLIGQSATGILEKVIGKVAPHWGKVVINNINRETIKQINKVLGPRFVTIMGSKSGVLVLGKQVPMFIGAGIGGVGNALFAAGIAKSAKNILGPLPKSWD